LFFVILVEIGFNVFLGGMCSGSSENPAEEFQGKDESEDTEKKLKNDHGESVSESELREAKNSQSEKEDALAENYRRGGKEFIQEGIKESPRKILENYDNIGRITPEHIQDEVRVNNEDFHKKL
jgi:hypothetical protein